MVDVVTLCVLAHEAKVMGATSFHKGIVAPHRSQAHPTTHIPSPALPNDGQVID